jgi:hypothetical protein
VLSTGVSLALVAACMSLRVLTNLSTEERPSVENARSATAFTRYSAGAMSTVEKLLWYIVMHRVSAATIPTNLFDDGFPVSSVKRPPVHFDRPLKPPLIDEKNFFMCLIVILCSIYSINLSTDGYLRTNF